MYCNSQSSRWPMVSRPPFPSWSLSVLCPSSDESLKVTDDSTLAVWSDDNVDDSRLAGQRLRPVDAVSVSPLLLALPLPHSSGSLPPGVCLEELGASAIYVGHRDERATFCSTMGMGACPGGGGKSGMLLGWRSCNMCQLSQVSVRIPSARLISPARTKLFSATAVRSVLEASLSL